MRKHPRTKALRSAKARNPANDAGRGGGNGTPLRSANSRNVDSRTVLSKCTCKWTFGNRDNSRTRRTLGRHPHPGPHNFPTPQLGPAGPGPHTGGVARPNTTPRFRAVIWTASTPFDTRFQKGPIVTAHVAFFGLVVDDMARSLAFYRALGLDIPDSADEQPHVEHELPGGLKLLWDTVETIRSFDPEWTAPTGGHRIALVFACPDPASVDATFDRLGELGHRGHKKPWDAVWGQRYAVVLDPDGNHVELCAALPNS